MLDLENEEFPIRALVLECINKGRPIGEQELLDRYNKLCERHKVLPLYGQMKTALKNLWQAGAIKLVGEGDAKKVVKA